MKNIKLFLILALGVMLSMDAHAQPGGVSRGPFGTVSTYTATHMNCVNAQGVAKGWNLDTLSNVDTGYAYIFVGEGFNMAVDVIYTTVTGTVGTPNLTLYGITNGGKPVSAASIPWVTTTTQYALTGNTTYCTGCVGASSTTAPGASKLYRWELPQNAGAMFDNYVLRVIQTGTATATYKAALVTEQ